MSAPSRALRVLRLAVPCALLAAVAACSAGPAGVVDLEGRAVDPLEDDSAAQVLVFVRTDCPIANRYAPELRRLAEDFASRRVALSLVYPDPDEGPEQIATHLAEYGLKAPGIRALRDPEHSLVARAQARVTPSAAVFAGGELAYTGSIDDMWVEFGRARPHASKRYLAQAVDAVLAGKPPEVAETKAIGCYIPPLEGATP
ncbi:MAG: hypothetical protein H6744_03225 [Deltaproteobacteria bacterium]|nr:hypothetical protein [Deltaproteobacteria bacterium]MCB9785687.1 hypothetical protein [Deltaproteobacteria bacterium]